MGTSSVMLGVLAVVGFTFNAPYRGCIANPIYALFFGAAGLGAVLGLGSLFRRDDRGQHALGVMGIVACIASPWVGGQFARFLPRDPARTDSATMGDIRTVISAQAAYQSSSGGFYGTLTCLAAPAQCIPAYPMNAPTFLDSNLASLQPQSGHKRAFFPFPAEAQGSPPAITAWAYATMPISPETGTRGLCGDSSGMICYTPDLSMPVVRDGQCVIVDRRPIWSDRGACYALR